MLRIGHGYDVHAFCEGSFIVLGGVKIEYDKGLEAHSDGDVVIHALCDALLGAAALGDIGKHFPDNNIQHKNKDSREFLRSVLELLKQRQWLVNNVDVTIISQAPKLITYMDEMSVNIASDLKTDINCVNIKATTTEKLGYIGRGEGIAVHAVALISGP